MASTIAALEAVRAALGTKLVGLVESKYEIVQVPDGKKISDLSRHIREYPESEELDTSTGVTVTEPGEMAIYLRTTDPFTLAHEIGHALDNFYHYTLCKQVVGDEFAIAIVSHEYLRGYSMTNIGEFFADGVAAYADFGLKCDCCGETFAKRSDLNHCHPFMHDFIAQEIERLNV